MTIARQHDQDPNPITRNEGGIMGVVFRNGLWAFIAWQQASLAAASFARFGLPAAILTLICIGLANTIFAAWIKGDFK